MSRIPAEILTQGAETKESWIWGPPGLLRKTHLKKKKKNLPHRLVDKKVFAEFCLLVCLFGGGDGTQGSATHPSPTDDFYG
jgi:hypothetical protein